MRLPVTTEELTSDFAAAQRGKQSRHSVADRVRPSIWQYDWLLLSQLAQDIDALIPHPGGPAVALDIGSGRSPYAAHLHQAGYEVRTLDIDAESGADFVGAVEATGLPSESFDLLICTQVLEHCLEPWVAVREMRRILKPGGYAVVSVPHVWFYHPHPSDNWRFTQEGLTRLVRGAGFEVEQLLAQRGSVAALAQIVNFLAYGVLGRLGAPLYATVSMVGCILDTLMPNPLFTLNLACRARRSPSQ